MATTPVFSLTGKVAMVYGGSYGIGKGICAVLSNAGATVVCVARDKEKGDDDHRCLRTYTHTVCARRA